MSRHASSAHYHPAHRWIEDKTHRGHAIIEQVHADLKNSALVGKLVGYSIPMSVAIGLTSLYGFPGTMILSQEAAKGAGETPEEVAAIENSILPKMIVAGFSTVTITSVIVTSIIAGRIGN